ncbi:MAG TPA: PA2778 family cysteine peptidase [Bacteriovoracaceae bacterium]|nr:PA2778 family cysteine peptidase [Bacteriovoracaceae bacterium]
MKLSLILLTFLLCGSCATRGFELQKEQKISPVQRQIPVPFMAQEAYHCGPAALAMVSGHLGKKIEASEVSKLLYSPSSKGTFQNHLLSAARRLGFVAVPVSTSEDLLVELSRGNPVLVFQNLGLSWYPKWHYALVVGYDLKRDELILHSGKVENLRQKISSFERTWKKAGNWALVIVKPGTLVSTAPEASMVTATAGLELAGHAEPARLSYEKILGHWPGSLGSLVGLGNICYQLGEVRMAKGFLAEATRLHPQASGAWYNYAVVLLAVKERQLAKRAIEKAIEFTDPDSARVFRNDFKDILTD